MKDGDTKGQEQLIRNLKERLHWYAYECEPEEFNEKEVKTIVDLLKQLDPIEPQEYFNARKGVERFWKYYEQRMEEEEDLDRLGARHAERRKHGGNNSHDDMEAARDMDVLDYVGAAKKREREPAACGNLAEKKIMDKEIRGSGRGGFLKSRFSFFRRHKAMTGTVAAAALVVMVMFGGTFGAYAEKDTGFFHWISKDKSGVEVITSPGSSVDSLTAVSGTTKYYSIEEVPEEYKQQIWLPNDVPDDLYLHYFEGIETKGWKRVQSIYGDDDLDIRFSIGVKFFGSEVLFQRQTYDEFDFMYEEKVGDIILEFFEQAGDDETKYAVCFYTGDKQYVVQGNLSPDAIKNIAFDYAEAVL